MSLLRAARPEVDEPAARTLVHAALGVANSLVRIPHLRNRPMLERAIVALVSAVLRAPL
ncbi:MAG TPA: hypothetical protein VIS06_18170 [Mycobacteriales bacterium]